MSRVKSKNLFKFQLTGVYDDDVAAADEELAKQLQSGGEEEASAMARLIKAMNNDDPESNQEYVTLLRDIMESHMKPLFSHPILEKSAYEVIEKEIKISTNHDGDFGVPVFVYTPKKFLGDGKKHAAYIYAHGGGCVGLNARLYKNLLCHYSVECDVVVFDYPFSDTASMTKEEKENNPGMRKIWKLVAADFEAQKNDPLLFPGKSSDDVLEKFPPTIIEEAEFDMFITEATRLAYRLRRAGRLLELIVIPGGKHGSSMDPRFKNFKIGVEVKKLTFQHYVHN